MTEGGWLYIVMDPSKWKTALHFENSVRLRNSESFSRVLFRSRANDCG